MSCDDIRGGDGIESYVHRRLTERERDAFEAHILECEACFDALQNYRALRSVMGSRVASPSWRSPSVLAGLAAAAALMLAIVATLRTPETVANDSPALTLPREAAAPPPPTPQRTADPVTPSRVVLVDQLARFDPPRYEPPVLRGAEDAARAGFQSAMQHYQAGDFTAAAGALQTELKVNPTPELMFYLGISELRRGRADAARTLFERVIASGDFLFEEDAHFFLGKTLLLSGDVAKARAEFDKVVTLRGDREQESRKLRSAIDQLPAK